ncbi:hypothetical protein [Microbulbifer sp. SSSA005]|uniref:hypothetical protein n=1 Tax=unclassified Microbulbifer TaxID=2619833 RepID=UPI00403A3F92
MSISYYKSIVNNLCIILISLILVACGGGGSSSDDSSTETPSSGDPGQGGTNNNTLPVINNLSITPDQAYNDSTLSVLLDVSDEDGDLLEVTYTWKNNDQVINEVTEPYLAPSYFNHGDSISVEVAITDGEDSVSQSTSITIQNRAPIIESLSFLNLPIFTTTDIEATIDISNVDNDPLTIEYHWTVNQELVSDVITNILPSNHFLKGDEVAVKAVVSDGDLTVEVTTSTHIQDTLPVMSVINMPDTVQYGEPVGFQVVVEDPDNDPYHLEFLARPNGMKIDEDDNISWTPTGPMFEKEMDIQWELSLLQEDYSHSEGRMIKVLDEERKVPLSNGYIETTFDSPDLAVGDIDGDGIKEIVATNGRRRLFALGSDGDEYAIKWEHPYALVEGEGPTYHDYNDLYYSCLTLIDLNDDGREEILAGLQGHAIWSHDTTGIFLFDDNLRPKRVATLTGNEVQQIYVTDLDNDQTLEIIALVDLYNSFRGEEPDDFKDQMQLVILSTDDYSVEWQSEILQLGATFTVGNLDSDSELEIVLGGGYVFDYINGSYTLSWHYEEGFTSNNDSASLDIADIDMDGIGEIIGTHPTSKVLTFYNANTQEIKLENEIKHSNFVTFLSPEDATPRILVRETSPIKLQLYSFDIDSQKLIPKWISSPSVFSENMRVGNLDDDPELEFYFTNRNDVIIYSNSSDDGELEIEWQPKQHTTNLKDTLVDVKSTLTNTSSLYALGLATISSGNSHLMAFNPVTNSFSFSPTIPGIKNETTAAVLLDLQKDNTNEIAFVTGKTPGLYDIFSESIIWSGNPINEEIVSLTTGQLGNDRKTSMIATTKDNGIYAYDIDNYELLWSHNTGGGVDIKLIDTKNTEQFNVVAADNENIRLLTSDDNYQSFSTKFNIFNDIPEGQETPIYEFSKNSQINIADLDGDSVDEIIVLIKRVYKSWLMVLDGNLKFENLIYLGEHDVRSFVVQNYGTQHRNILFSSENDGRRYIIEIDPWTGKVISTSPELGPRMVHDSLRFIDSNNDGQYELGWLTEEGSVTITR